MPSTLRLSNMLLLALSLAATSGCCKPAKPPVLPVVEVPRSCVTASLLAARPAQSDPTTCSSQGNDVRDCLAHDVLERDAYITRLLANCGAKP